MGMDIKHKSVKFYLLGFIAGVLNGFFGAGGGLVVVPMLEYAELEPKKSHATSIAIILPLSIISGIMYILNGVEINFQTLLTTVPLGIIGAVAGSFLLPKIKNNWLRKIFALVMIFSAVRLLIK